MSKVTTMTKDKLLGLIKVEHRRLEKDIDSLTPEQQVECHVIGDWSVKDIMAHLTAWEQRMLGWWHAHTNGEGDPETKADLDLHAYNESVYQANRNRQLDEIAREFNSSYQKVLDTVESLSEVQLNSPVEFKWANNACWWELVAFNTYRHYRWATQRMGNWKKEHSELRPAKSHDIETFVEGSHSRIEG